MLQDLIVFQILDVDVDLAEGDVDAGCRELAVDDPVDLIDGHVAVGQLVDVDAQFVVQRALAEIEEVDDRRRVLEYPRVVAGSLQQQLAHQLEVGAVGHAELDGDAGDGVRQRPVDQLAGDEGLVRDDDFLAVEIGNGGGADTDAADRAGEVADGHGIADAHRAFEQDDQAGNEVGEDFLHAETDTQRQGGDQPLQLVPADPQYREGADEAKAEDGIGQQGGGGVGAALGQ